MKKKVKIIIIIIMIAIRECGGWVFCVQLGDTFRIHTRVIDQLNLSHARALLCLCSAKEEEEEATLSLSQATFPSSWNSSALLL